MARKLNVKQKQYLDKLMDENPNFRCVDDLSNKQEDVLSGMNDYETLWSDTERYISDRRLPEIHCKGLW